jgi:hypothetical protein
MKEKKEMNDVFKLDRGRVMWRAWQSWRGRTGYLYRTYGDALRASWREEKRSVARMNDRYNWEHGRGKYATPLPPMKYKPLSLSDDWGIPAESLVEYYSHSGR